VRRLLAAVLLVASVAVPARAAAPAPAAPPAPVRPGVVHHVPGRVPVAPVPAADWVDHQLEAASSGRLVTELLQRFDTARATASSTQRIRLATVFGIPDLDGDRVGDLLRYDTTVTVTDDGSYSGPLDLAVISGRTGALRWQRHWKDIALALPYDAKVGAAGKPGVLLVRPYRPSKNDTAYRLVGLGGARGEVAYDRTISSTDGLGDVSWGGTFNAYPGGGTDLLIGRAKHDMALGAGALGFNPSEIDEVQPFAVDGKDGKVRAVHDSMVAVGGRTAFLAAGDLDGDKRDDFVTAHQGLRDTGEVTAYSVVENKQLWVNPNVPVGWVVQIGDSADVVGDKKADVVLSSWMLGNALLHVAGVTDGIALLEGVPEGIHGLLLDGAGGALKWDRVDGKLASYSPIGDVDRDGKSDVLAVGLIEPSGRDGLRFLAVTGANKVLYRKDVTVRRAPARKFLGAAIASAGDVDRDGLPDLYYVVVSASELGQYFTEGYLFTRHGTAVTSDEPPLGASLDGRGDDRLSATLKKSVLTVTMRDGLHGTPYWHLTLPTGSYGWGLAIIDGQRGRCDGILLVAYGHQEGSMWAAALDGGTGRTRWKRQVSGAAIHPPVKAGGAAAHCG
jgi:hypothetical protein